MKDQNLQGNRKFRNRKNQNYKRGSRNQSKKKKNPIDSINKLAFSKDR